MNMTNGPLHAFVASLLMLGTMLCCYCTVAVVREMNPPPPCPAYECPAREECWRVCVSMAEIAAESAARTCVTASDNMALLTECEHQLFELRYQDFEDHCSERIELMFHEMYWEHRDPDLDEWEAGTSEG